MQFENTCRQINSITSNSTMKPESSPEVIPQAAVVWWDAFD